MDTLSDWLFIAVVFGILWAFWQVMNLSANAFSQWWNAPREPDQPSAEDGGKRVEGKVT